MTTANKITLFRVLCIPVFIVLMYLDGPAMQYAALAVFVIASLSDFVDGYIARHYNQVSNFGKFMDPLADKMLVITAMLLSGKVKTACTMVGIILILAVGQSASFSTLLDGACSIVILITTVYSGVEYFVVNRDVLKNETV